MVESATLRNRIVAYLRLCEREGALYTSDIAWGVRDRYGTANTPAANRELRRMERDGTVERVCLGGNGHPTSWRLAPPTAAGVAGKEE